MNSSRFPGKVLAPLAGQPIVRHVLERVAAAVPRTDVVVATSDRPSDDPLAAYVSSLGFSVFRGELDNCVQRFQDALARHPCEWFFRVCADSPLYEPSIMRQALTRRGPAVDLITNTFPRSFPRGNSVELIRSATFAALPMPRLTADQREHATKYFYENSDQYGIVNIDNPDSPRAHESLVVDTPEDLARLGARLSQTLTPAVAPPREVRA